MQAVPTPVVAPPSRLLIWLALGAVYIIWGSTYLFIHLMTEQMPPLYMASLRFLIAGTLLYTYARLTGHARPTRHQWQSAGILGVLMLTIANGAMTLSLQHIPTGFAALLSAMFPIILLTINWIGFNKTRPTRLAMIGLVLGIAGVGLLIKPDNLQSEASLHEKLIGVFFVTLGNLSWAFGTLLSPRLRLPGGLLASGMQMLVGGVLLLIISLITEPVTLWTVLDAPRLALGSLAYLVVFGSIIGFSAYSFLTRNAPPALVSTYAYVNPVVAMILGTTFAGELISGQALLGAAVILSGVVLITLGRKT
jgi:drug/metabolite transporter (DMT)-like permease